MSRRHGWLVGGEPTRRCGRAVTDTNGRRIICAHPVFVAFIAHRVLGTVARYVCVNNRCARYDEATALRYER